MNDVPKPAEEFPPEVHRLYEKLDREARAAGYRLNPDRPFTLRIVQGLLVNEQRHGYWSCPCRRAHGQRPKDLDIICPCNYRDADLEEFGACYCALYVSEDWIAGKKPHKSIPERRPADYTFDGYRAPETPVPADAGGPALGKLPYPVWRCQVCGYLAARDGPPGVCPICKAGKDRFERFL